MENVRSSLTPLRVNITGTASPMLIPEFSEEEKLQGSIDHTYCAGVDILYDVNATGSLESVLKGRFAMTSPETHPQT